jgi:hypothetical protein
MPTLLKLIIGISAVASAVGACFLGVFGGIGVGVTTTVVLGVICYVIGALMQKTVPWHERISPDELLQFQKSMVLDDQENTYFLAAYSHKNDGLPKGFAYKQALFTVYASGHADDQMRAQANLLLMMANGWAEQSEVDALTLGIECENAWKSGER